MAETAAGDTATIDAGGRRIGAPCLHECPGVVLGALRLRRRAASSLDTDPRLQNQWSDGPRVCRDDGSRVERSRGAGVVPLARQQAEVHTRQQGWTLTADDSLPAHSDFDHCRVGGDSGGAGASTPDGHSRLLCAGRGLDHAGAAARIHVRELPAPLHRERAVAVSYTHLTLPTIYPV